MSSESVFFFVDVLDFFAVGLGILFAVVIVVTADVLIAAVVEGSFRVVLTRVVSGILSSVELSTIVVLSVVATMVVERGNGLSVVSFATSLEYGVVVHISSVVEVFVVVVGGLLVVLSVTGSRTVVSALMRSTIELKSDPGSVVCSSTASSKLGPLPILPFSVAGIVAMSSCVAVVDSLAPSIAVVEGTGRPRSSCKSIIFLSIKSRSLSITKGMRVDACPSSSVVISPCGVVVIAGASS